jgi:DNA polymerase/3'-5' exonuclease PolX
MMRNKAIKLGFKLNEYSLVKANESNTQIYLDSEERIFEYLKLDYIKPENR